VVSKKYTEQDCRAINAKDYLNQLFRIAHLSDLHVLSAAGFEWRRMLFNKRITGYANLLLHRSRVYRRDYLRAVVAAAVAQADHVVVTGDITNLSLESEYEGARALLDDVARSVEVSVVPGNHDVYLPSIHHERRFTRHFAAFLHSDLPQFACDLPAGPFPYVKLRGPLAIIGLSSAVPRPPFVSAGYLGQVQLAALADLLAHPEVVRRTPVVLLHHPPVDARWSIARLRDGLVDAASLSRTLRALSHGLVLYGHTHVRVRCRMLTTSGALDVVSASGAALDHRSDGVRAGFNRYEIADDGRIISIESHVIDRSGRGFRSIAITERRSCL
jgi:3',5'-cyclic AMP phosphodiesterase CpdA